MKYQGKEIEILSRKLVFRKQIAEVKILSTGEIKSVPFSELSDEKKVPIDAEVVSSPQFVELKVKLFQSYL